MVISMDLIYSSNPPPKKKSFTSSLEFSVSTWFGLLHFTFGCDFQEKMEHILEPCSHVAHIDPWWWHPPAPRIHRAQGCRLVTATVGKWAVSKSNWGLGLSNFQAMTCRPYIEFVDRLPCLWLDKTFILLVRASLVPAMFNSASWAQWPSVMAPCKVQKHQKLMWLVVQPPVSQKSSWVNHEMSRCLKNRTRHNQAFTISFLLDI